jgi:hypothetical protein
MIKPAAGLANIHIGISSNTILIIKPPDVPIANPTLPPNAIAIGRSELFFCCLFITSHKLFAEEVVFKVGRTANTGKTHIFQFLLHVMYRCRIYPG